MGYLTDYVQHKGIREQYQTGTAADYNNWLSDDNATDDFEGTMDHFGAVSGAKKEALKRAEKEYSRREKGKSEREANSNRIKSLEAQLAQQNSGAADAAAQAKAQQEAAIKQQNDMQASSRMNAQQQYQKTVDDFESPNNSVKDQIAAIKARNPFGNSFTQRINQASGQQPSTQKPVDTAQQFADQYKLDLISSGMTKSEKNKEAFLAG